MARGGDLEKVRVTASDLLGPKDARTGNTAIDIFREHEVTFSRSSPGVPFPPGYYPDALIPVRYPYTGKDLEGATYDGQPFDLPSGQNQPIWVDVRIPQDARPGDYNGSITVRTGNGAVSTLPFKLTVWDFDLPLKPEMPSSIGQAIGACFSGYPPSEPIQQLDGTGSPIGVARKHVSKTGGKG